VNRQAERLAWKNWIEKIKNHYGESGLKVRIRWFAVLVLLTLAACSSQTPAPVEDREVETRVREPASEDSEGKQLTAQAQSAEQVGQLDKAGGYIERALRIQPRDPQLLQHMAEIKLQKEDYHQALNFATKSYDIGPRVGEICSRNWRTISVARDHLDDSAGKPKGL
jgi:tetratricopeptide (TPR) repeat protein